MMAGKPKGKTKTEKEAEAKVAEEAKIKEDAKIVKENETKKAPKEKEEPKKEKNYYKKAIFEPVNSATQTKIFDLTVTKNIEIDGVLQKTKEPKYKSLPAYLTVYKGDIPLKLTKEQYDDLKKEGIIETREERDERFRLGEKAIPKQHGVDKRLAPASKIAKLYENILVEVDE